MRRRLIILCGFASSVAAHWKSTRPSRPSQPCRIEAWVRAPDLSPGSIIQGDVRVRAEGPDCDEVESYSLGLRFSERASLRTLRLGATLPEAPGEGNDTDKWPFYEKPRVWWEYEQEHQNPMLWEWHAEERFEFETSYMLNSFHGGTFTTSFALLVPNTNYPPVPATSNNLCGPSRGDKSSADHSYQYFVDASFKNGTSRRVPAGTTAFIPKQDNQAPPSSPETVTVSLQSCPCRRGDKRCIAPPAAVQNVTLHVTFPNGRTFKQGSSETLTIVVADLDWQRPARLSPIRVRRKVNEYHSWAQRLSTNQTDARFMPIDFSYTPEKQLDATIMGHRDPWMYAPPSFSSGIRPIREDGNINTGSPVTQTVDIEENALIDFNTHYRVLRNVLSFSTHVSGEAEHDSDEKIEIDPEEEEWELPGSFDRPMSPIGIFFNGEVDITVLPSDDLLKVRPTHYLSANARHPTFVDPSEVEGLETKTVEERDERAPLIMATIQEDAELPEDFFPKEAFEAPSSSRSGGFYVGDLWRKKVGKLDNKQSAPHISGWWEKASAVASEAIVVQNP